MNAQEYTIKGWVARDKEADELILVLGKEKPSRMETYWFAGFSWGYTPIHDDIFPELTWESEPVEVELTIKRYERDITKTD